MNLDSKREQKEEPKPMSVKKKQLDDSEHSSEEEIGMKTVKKPHKKLDMKPKPRWKRVLIIAKNPHH